jgi:hypothetical protein
MVDDLVDYRATVLVWASMGGGSLSLPYLEQEAFGEIDARARFYGFVNDSEFIAACHEHDIKVFGIVFEAQGWEFPVELDDDERTVLAINELRGIGHRDWMGLREFSQNRYPHLWKPLQHYFPDGLRNSDGEPVTDLIEECGVRDIHQQLCHAHWVECPDREHQCYYMDRNNPVWREYLKAVIRIQIDAGVDGIQLDEAELPLGAMQYGACFCKDCMKGFRQYLRDQSPEDRDTALEGPTSTTSTTATGCSSAATTSRSLARRHRCSATTTGSSACDQDVLQGAGRLRPRVRPRGRARGPGVGQLLQRRPALPAAGRRL